MFARTAACCMAIACLLFTQLSLAATLRVGVSADSPPLIYKEQQLTGIEVANAQVLGEYLKYKIEYVEKPRAQLANALASGEIDIIMSGATDSAAALASKPVMPAPVQVVIRFDDAGLNAYKGVLFRPGNKIGVVRASAGEKLAAELLKQAQLSHFDSQAAALAALQNKRIDFLLLTQPEAQFLARNPNYSDLLPLDNALSDDHIYWLVKNGNSALLEKVNRALAEMQQTGTLRAVINQWLPVRASTEH